MMSKGKDDERDAMLQRQIDENLKRVYQQALEEKVPDRLLQLLEQLKRQDQQEPQEPPK